MTDTPNRFLRLSEFSRLPDGVARFEGPTSAEAYREDVLLPALKEAEREGVNLVIRVDSFGLPQTWIIGAFGTVSVGEFAELIKLEAESSLHSVSVSRIKDWLEAARAGHNRKQRRRHNPDLTGL